MNEKLLSQITLYFVGFVSLIIWSVLIWQYMHDGVPSHHLLNRADLPTISNWWGGLLLPVLSWVMLKRIRNRVLKSSTNSNLLVFKYVFFSFFLALSFAAIFSFSFINGYSEMTSIMFPGVLFLAIFFKVYKEEYLLGLILGMNFTFGAVLPTIFGSIIALLSFTIYSLTRFILFKVKKIMPTKQVNE